MKTYHITAGDFTKMAAPKYAAFRWKDRRLYQRGVATNIMLRTEPQDPETISFHVQLPDGTLIPAGTREQQAYWLAMKIAWQIEVQATLDCVKCDRKFAGREHDQLCTDCLTPFIQNVVVQATDRDRLV